MRLTLTLNNVQYMKKQGCFSDSLSIVAFHLLV